FVKEFSDETLIENFESELNSTQYSIFTEAEGSNAFLKGPTASGPDIVWESADFLEVYRIKGITVRIDPAYRFSPNTGIVRDAFGLTVPAYSSINELTGYSTIGIDPAIKTQSISLTEPELLYTWTIATNAQYQENSQLTSNAVVILNPPVITRPATAE
ncbi:hypothetical protein, partial [Escherichia coli]|uniref:hypothetical protein n=1 Tax=Escherichia coli TaxID=562 RepID=UPI00148502FD